MTTVNLQPDGTAGLDTYIRQGLPTSVLGTQTDIQVGAASGGASDILKSIIQFDLSSIPTDAIISSATLRLYLAGDNGFPAGQNITIHRGLVVWNEGQSSWNNRVTSTTWAGGAGGVSGTEYAVSATATVSVGAQGADYDFNVLADVIDIVNSAGTNTGWWLLGSSTTVNELKSFSSSDNATAANRPELIIDYTVPVHEIEGSSNGSSIVTGILAQIGSVSVDIQPNAANGKDTAIASGVPNNNLGINTVLTTGSTVKGLIQFDLSFISEKATILQATLSLVCSTPSATPGDIAIHRSLVEWFEGDATSGTTTINGSTWNFRNHIGSVVWLGGAGGGSASDYDSVATDTESVDGLGTFTWDLSSDVQDFISGAETNYGWWLLYVSGGTRDFRSSDYSTAGDRPLLSITYLFQNLEGSINGNSQSSGNLIGAVYVEGISSGVANASATLSSNQEISGVSQGSTSVVATLLAKGYANGASSGVVTVLGDILGTILISGTSTASALVSGHAKHVLELSGSLLGQAFLSASLEGEGYLRGSIAAGSVLVGAMWRNRPGVKQDEGCNHVPLLYITDGRFKENGQLNILNLLSEKSGYRLKNWRPKVAQYKEGGRWSNSPTATGRRPKSRVFDNSIEVFELEALGYGQDRVIQYSREYFAFQEAAIDYWASEWAERPIYLVARAARETQTRYAVIYMMSCPELEDPYQQPFFTDDVAVMSDITLRIERGHWTSQPPGEFECVAVSSIRSWTVAAWQSGS